MFQRKANMVFHTQFTGKRALSRVLRVVWRQKLLNLTQFELVSWLRSDGEHRSRQSNSGSLLQYRDRTLSEPKSAKSAFRAILEPIWLFQTRIAFNYDKKRKALSNKCVYIHFDGYEAPKLRNPRNPSEPCNTLL